MASTLARSRSGGWRERLRDLDRAERALLEMLSCLARPCGEGGVADRAGRSVGEHDGFAAIGDHPVLDDVADRAG